MAGDCRTARELTADDSAAFCGWGSATLGSYEILSTQNPPLCSAPCRETRHSWAESRVVETTIEVTRPDSGHSMSVGDRSWSFIVGRQTSTDPWRIIDAGALV